MESFGFADLFDEQKHNAPLNHSHFTTNVRVSLLFKPSLLLASQT